MIFRGDARRYALAFGVGFIVGCFMYLTTFNWSYTVIYNERSMQIKEVYQKQLSLQYDVTTKLTTHHSPAPPTQELKKDTEHDADMQKEDQQQEEGHKDQQEEEGHKDQQQEKGHSDQQQEEGHNDQQQEKGHSDQQKEEGHIDQQQEEGHKDQQKEEGHIDQQQGEGHHQQDTHKLNAREEIEKYESKVTKTHKNRVDGDVIDPEKDLIDDIVKIDTKDNEPEEETESAKVGKISMNETFSKSRLQHMRVYNENVTIDSWQSQFMSSPKNQTNVISGIQNEGSSINGSSEIRDSTNNSFNGVRKISKSESQFIEAKAKEEIIKRQIEEGNNAYIGEMRHNRGETSHRVPRVGVSGIHNVNEGNMSMTPGDAEKSRTHRGDEGLSRTLKAGIPKIIHQTWETGMIPQEFAKNVSTWHENHPNWKYYLWTTAGGRKLLERKHSDKLLLYDTYKLKIQRADVRRYFLLYEYGGVYADLDVENLRPLDNLLSEFTCVVAREPDVHRLLLYKNQLPIYPLNTLMACRPRHPFFKFVIDKLEEYQIKYPTDVLRSTGPIFLSKVLTEYRRTHNDTLEDRVLIAPANWFTPMYDPMQETSVRNLCHESMVSRLSPEEQRLCGRLERLHFINTPSSRSYCTHYWAHTYSAGYQSNSSISITDVINKAIII